MVDTNKQIYDHRLCSDFLAKSRVRHPICWGWSMPRTQTLNDKHTQRERTRFTRFKKMPTSQGQRERSIDDLHKIQEDYNWLSQELSAQINLHKMWYILYLYGGEETPKSIAVRVQNYIWPDCQSIARSTAYLQSCRTYWICRSTVWLTDLLGFSPLYQLRSIKRLTDPSLVHVGRPPDRLKSCHRVKKTLSPVFTLSL